LPGGDVVVIGWTRFNQVPLISPDYSALDPSARRRRPGRARDPARLDPTALACRDAALV